MVSVMGVTSKIRLRKGCDFCLEHAFLLSDSCFEGSQLPAMSCFTGSMSSGAETQGVDGNTYVPESEGSVLQHVVEVRGRQLCASGK